MLTSMEGRSVIVTGGSKGIGKGIARAFASNGARVLVVGRDLAQAQATVDDLTAAGGTASAFAGDVCSEPDMQAMAAAAVERHGGLDVLCANAGIFPAARLKDMTVEDWDTVMDTNLKGMFLSAKACLPALKARGQGRIVLTSSITGPITGYPGWTHYGATKAGQLGWMRTACLELAPYNITVNAVMPGNIMTEGLAGMGQDYLDKMTASIPIGRLGTVDDIAHAVLYLASDEAAFVTGQTIAVDGGQVVPEGSMALEDMAE